MKSVHTLFILLFISFFSFAQETAPDKNQLDHSIFFVGDLGEAAVVESNLEMLQTHLNQINEKGTLVFLGNTISKDYGKEENEDVLTEDINLKKVLDLAKSFKGELVFLPGEKEWFQKRKNSWESLLNLETSIEDYIGKGDVFLPNGACPGPG